MKLQLKRPSFVRGAVLVVLSSIAGVVAGATPYTHLNYLNDPDEFQFAIVPDRTGGDYRGAFTNALAKVNLLRPEFVMSVGDLIPAGWAPPDDIRRQQTELTNMLAKVVPPFFCVVGNHDITRSQKRFPTANEDSTAVWKEFHGPDTYYSFVYKDVLFVCLNSFEGRNQRQKCGITPEQYAWFGKTLAEHPDVRWTFVFMHCPGDWTTSAWRTFEKEHLVNRRHTVFAGDWHCYVHAKRYGHDYYALGVAGGTSAVHCYEPDRRPELAGPDYGEMDHVTWVTMTKAGPVVANVLIDGVLPGDYLNTKTTRSTYPTSVLDAPADEETVRRVASNVVDRTAYKKAVDAAKAARAKGPDGRAVALQEMLDFARMAEKELRHTPTCGEKQSTYGSGDSTPRAIRTTICALSVFDTLGKSDVADAAHWEKLAAEVDKTLFFAAETSVGKSNEALFKCFDGRPWGALGLMGFTEDFPRLENADPFMQANPRPLTVRTDPDWFPGVAEAELPVAGAYDRCAVLAERAYRASCAYRGVTYAAPGRDVRAGGFVGLNRAESGASGWYEDNEYKLDTVICETAPLGEGEGPKDVLRRQLRVRKTGPRTALVRERVFVLNDCELPRGLLAVPFAEGAYRVLSGENRRTDGFLSAKAGETLYDVTYAVDVDADAARLAKCRGLRMEVAYVTEPGDETEAWQAKIDAASAVGGGTVTVPAGAHKVAQLELKDNVTLELAEGATLFAVTNGTAYRWTPWIKAELQEAGVVVAYGATNIGIVGKGTIDGCGDVRPFFRTDEVRWRNLYLRNCRSVRIEGIRFDHPSFWTMFLRACDRVHMKGVTVRAFANINNDGMDLCVANSLIEDCAIDSEDDALVLKSFDPDFVAENVEIRNCRIATTGNCIKFGTETFSPYRNYEIHHCSLGAADRFGPRAPNFVRYPMMVTNEYWCEGGLVFLTVDGGTIEDVRVHDIELRGGVRIPFAFRFGHRYGEENWGRSVIRGVTLERVTMEKPSACAVGCFVSGIAGCDVEDVTIRDSHFKMRAFPDGVRRLHAKFPENARRYPSPGMFDGALPGYFLFTTHAKNVRLENVKVDLTGEGEKRPVVVADEKGSVSVKDCAFGVFER